jgi:predicted MFS family arabinose efflux permease
LSTYNFAGDLGKATLPALASVLLTLMPWRIVLWVIALIGLTSAATIAWRMPPIVGAATSPARPGPAAGGGRGGFTLLLTIGVLDTGVRMGLLTFLPFLLTGKGASLPDIGLALSLVFIGGAAGKFTCGWLCSRVGVMWTVLLTESGTALCIFAALWLPLGPLLVLLPVLGLMLNGTSSVLYGTVPELSAPERVEHAFALFYTGTIGSGAVTPVLYGLLGDAIGARGAVVATACTALATLPLALVLAPRLVRDGSVGAL